jgi:hypothetical protein
VTPLSIGGLLSLSYYCAPFALTAPLLAITTGATIVLLARAYILASEIEEARCGNLRFIMRMHIILHAVPFAYLMTKLFSRPAPFSELVWLAAFLCFFYTGKRSWTTLFNIYKSKMYYVFYRGNTGLLFMLPLLSALSLFFEDVAETSLVGRILMIYSVIHFLLIGVSVLKIANDVASTRR